MNELKELWAGQIYGTNTGKVFLEIIAKDEGLAGILRISDDQFGLSVYDITGTFDGGALALVGTPKDPPPEIAHGKIEATAKLQSNGQFWGEWKSEIGTAGTFELYPHIGTRTSDAPSVPEQLYTANRDLGALRLYRNDVIDIITVLKRKFPGSRIVVSHLDRGSELARFSDEFENTLDRIDKLNWIKIAVQSPAGEGLSRSVTIDLGAAVNRVTTQGPDESWVLGEAEATVSFLKQREKRLSTAIGRYRVNLNLVIVLAAIVVMPDLPLIQRLVFMISTVTIVLVADRVQRNLIPNFIANFSESRPGVASQIWPSVLSWLISASAGVASSVIYGLLT